LPYTRATSLVESPSWAVHKLVLNITTKETLKYEVKIRWPLWGEFFDVLEQIFFFSNRKLLNQSK
jgi:hypothetical protein